MFAKVMCISETAMQVDIIVVTTLIGSGVGKGRIGGVLRISELADICHFQIIIIIVPRIDLVPLCRLKCFVGIKADSAIQSESREHGTKVVFGIQRRIKIAPTVLLNPGTTKIAYRVVGRRRRVNTSIGIVGGSHRIGLNHTKGHKSEHPFCGLADIVDTTAKVKGNIEIFTHINVDVGTKVPTIQQMLCREVGIHFRAFLIPHAFLAQIGKAHIVACPMIATADLQIGTILRCGITIKLIRP